MLKMENEIQKNKLRTTSFKDFESVHYFLQTKAINNCTKTKNKNDYIYSLSSRKSMNIILANDKKIICEEFNIFFINIADSVKKNNEKSFSYFMY